MATIPGLSVTPVAWWRAADRDTLELDASDNVRKWRDKSGNGRDLFTSDTSSTRRMKYIAADARVGGRPSVSATAANQLLQTATEAANGTPTNYSLDVREIYVVTMYSDGVKTSFTKDNNVIGWGPGAVAGSNDGYSALIGGSVNGASGGNPRFMGNINSGRVISTSAIATEGAYRNRDTFPSGDGNTAKPILLPLPLSLLRILVTSTVINASRIIGNMDVGASRAWSGPILEIVMFDQPLSEADRKIMQDYALYGYGIETPPATGATGALASTLGSVVAAGRGKLGIVGRLARALGGVTTLSAAKLLLQGQGAGRLGDVTLSARGRPLVAGRLARTLAPVSTASAGNLRVTGQGSGRLDDVALAARGDLPLVGRVEAVLADMTVEGRSATVAEGRLRERLEDVTGTSTGVSTYRGEAHIRLDDTATASTGESSQAGSGRLSGFLGNAKLVARGALRVRAQTNATLDDVTAAAETLQGRFGALNATLGDVISISSAEFVPPITGTGSGLLDDVTSTGEGRIDLRGRLDVILDDITANAGIALAITAKVAATLGDIVLRAFTGNEPRPPAARTITVAFGRRTFYALESGTLMSLNRASLVKDPNDILDYGIDWKHALVPGDSVLTAQWFADGVTMTDELLAGTMATVWLAGGTLGSCVTVTCRVVTVGGRQMDQSFEIEIRER